MYLIPRVDVRSTLKWHYFAKSCKKSIGCSLLWRNQATIRSDLQAKHWVLLFLPMFPRDLQTPPKGETNEFPPMFPLRRFIMTLTRSSMLTKEMQIDWSVMTVVDPHAQSSHSYELCDPRLLEGFGWKLIIWAIASWLSVFLRRYCKWWHIHSCHGGNKWVIKTINQQGCLPNVYQIWLTLSWSGIYTNTTNHNSCC